MPRAALTIASLLLARRMLGAAPKGDGRPVMLLPGLVNSDRSMALMRRYLGRLGYRAVGWGLGRNLGVRAIGAEGDRLIAEVAKLHQQTGEKVTLVGVSLGGIMARFVAPRRPDLVREVITVSSPYAGDPRATRVWRQFQWLTGESLDNADVVARRIEIAKPLPVPATAIWSRNDGLVNGLICRAPEEPGLRCIEVRSGHLGVQVRPQVLRTIADVLGGVDTPPERSSR